jgi:hypothetical protein
MILKMTRFLPVLVLLCLTLFAATAFSINYTINNAWKESASNFKHDEHYSLEFLGDPVSGGGPPCPKSINETLN